VEGAAGEEAAGDAAPVAGLAGEPVAGLAGELEGSAALGGDAAAAAGAGVAGESLDDELDFFLPMNNRINSGACAAVPAHAAALARRAPRTKKKAGSRLFTPTHVPVAPRR